MQPTETLTLLSIEWGAALDATRAAELFDHGGVGPTVCPCPVPGVTLLAYRSATGALEDALGVLDGFPAKIAMLTCEYGKLEYIGFSQVSGRLYGLLRLLPPGVAICALSTYEAVRHASADRALFVDLGPVGLPDVGGRERVFQVCRFGADPGQITLDRGERAIDTLPSEFGYLVGRKVEMDRACMQIEQGRSITLTGVSGIGKSHLANRIARELRSAFASGVAWVSLPGATSLRQATAALATALGVAADSELAAVRPIVMEEPVLIVFDGVDSCRELIKGWIDGLFRGAGARFIVTATTPVGYADEEVVPVAPLTLPPPDVIDQPDDLYDFEASALFLDRVSEISERLTDHMEPDAVAELVRRLEGLPQRICMAAAQTRFQSVTMILRDLPPVAKGGPRSSLALSLGGLPQVAQDAAVALGLCETPVSLFQLGKLDERFQADMVALDTLLKSGLCQESLSQSGRVVYALYPSVRAQVRKIPSASRKKLARRHEQLFIGLVHEAVAGHNMTASAGDLDYAEEHAADVFVALGSLAKRGSADELYVAMRDAWPFLYDHNHVDESLGIVEAKISSERPGEHIAIARLLNIGGALASKAGWSRKARTCYETALARLDEGEDLLVRAKVVTNLASLEWSDGNPDGARDRFAFAADLFKYAGLNDGIASALVSSVASHIECGDSASAGEALEAAVALIEAPSPADYWLFAIGRAQVAWSRQNYGRAREHATEAVQLALAMNDQLSMLRSLIWLAQSLVDADEMSPSTHVLAVAGHNLTEQMYRLYPANERRVSRMRDRLVAGLGEDRYRAEFIAGSTQSLDQLLDSIC
ncbi:MAG: NACHT domain-containing protein [Fimbriimonadaceae bacterium]